MSITDLFSETFWALTGNKIRTALTILGIVIGIGSVITMVAIGQGSQAAIENSIAAIGSNLLIVTPGAQRGAGGFSAGRGSARTLTQADADAIKSTVTNTSGVAPELTSRYQIAAKGQNTNTSVTGTVPDYLTVRNVQIATGTFFADSQVSSDAKVAILGPTTVTDLYGTADPVGQTIRIRNIDFQVIGTTVAKGGTGFNNPDDIVYIPISTAQRFLSGGTYVSQISIAAKTQKVMSDVQQQITALLDQRHKITSSATADFSVINQADIAGAATSTTNTLTLLLASTAGISLFVGGIGIMNMMLTSVTERTREIGLRKAIGATNGDISRQFLMEAIMLTFIGGAIGVGLGWAAALALKQFANVSTQISITSIIAAFAVSAVVGIIFGYYPARRASLLKPIEALRYE